jgi:DNA polymerase I
MQEAQVSLDAIIIDVDYVNLNDSSVIRLTLKHDGETYTVLDKNFHPYLYLLPSNPKLDKDSIASLKITSEGKSVEISNVEERQMALRGKQYRVLCVETNNTRNVPKLKDALREFGECYEYDILFWKRYLINKKLSPFSGVSVKMHMEEGRYVLDSIENKEYKTDIRYVCFDIETYNPLGAPRPNKDPAIMISYTDGTERKVLTTKKINRDFVKTYSTEKEMIEAFTEFIRSTNADAIVGYNSSNFDIPYLEQRARATGADFAIGREGESIRTEHHGLIESVKIPGRMNLDVYNVTKFIATVGASEKLVRANRFTLSEVYAAITGDTKKMVDRANIWQQWDGTDEDREILADYSLGDSLALNELYKAFIPLEIEVSKAAGTTLAEACVSTTGQLVEYLLMRYANNNNEIVPNKPTETDIRIRESNPIEGAYVKTPEAGVYKNIAVFDFRGLYPSIIIAYNIDPSTMCNDCTEYHETPINIKFMKNPQGIMPQALRLLTKERAEIKKRAKQNPNDTALAARSQALKILANSFYGYLGYARSRWYTRDCAASVTALGRSHIKHTIEEAEKSGFKVLYSDTDSIFLLLGSQTKDHALTFLKSFNSTLPESMELELEDFYTSGVFVGKKSDGSGAKKKYALLSETGRIKIRGFELVRRDWSNIARETQRKVLEAILKDGNKPDAIKIVKDVVKNLRENRVPLGDLVIRTQLRKKIDNYDSKSPELSAVKKAIEKGVRKKDDMEGATVSYVITSDGSSISEKAALEEMAKDYDPDYYINHQVIPATLKILKELGVSEEELKGGGSQKRL